MARTRGGSTGLSSIRGTSRPVRWLIQLLTIAMIIGVSLTSSVVAAEAAAPAAEQAPTRTAPSTQAPASGTPAAAGFTLRVEPRTTGAVDRAAARARLAQLLGAQVGQATRAAGVPTTTSTPTAGTAGTRQAPAPAPA